MPSIFSSWRPSKLQVRLRKLSHQLGGGNAAIMGYHSSDEDDDEGAIHAGTVRKHNGQPQQKMGNPMIDNDFIVEASLSQRSDINRIPLLPPTSSQQRNNQQAVSNCHHQQSSLSDDEYFIRSPAMSRAAATANRHFPVTSPRFRMDEANRGGNEGALSNRLLNSQQSMPNNNNSLESSSSNSSSRRRAVRFSEENDVRNIRQQQPPICNVAPTTASQNVGNSRSTAYNNGHISSEDETQSLSLPASLQVRALTSPLPTNAAALPPKYSPSPALKLSGLYDNNPGPAASAKPVRQTTNNSTTPTTTINSNGPSSWQKGFSSMMMVDNNSETEMAANESDENSQAPPRPARTGLMGRNGAKNRANLLLQQLRSGGGGGNGDTDGMSSNGREQTNLAATATTTPIHPYPQQQQPRLGITTTSTSPVMTSGGVLFLEYNEEVKRIPFPSSIHSFQQVKSLFLKTFPDLTLEYLNLPFVKIYIQESTKSQIFYELDDLKDIKDRTLLKIRQHKQPVPPSSQHRPGFQSPPPSLRFNNHHQPLAAVLPSSGVDYFSEPELDYGAGRQQQQSHHYESGRVSASNGMLYGPQYPQRNNQHFHGGRPRAAMSDYGHTLQPDDALTSSGTSTLRGGGGDDLSTTASASYDPYYELYCSGSSDTASRHSRSGSSTPIIFNQQTQQQQDSEARQRMDVMEHQLANLSTLVHSAMISREMNPLLRREMMDLQRQILELQTPSSSSPNKLGNVNELVDRSGVGSGSGKPLVNGVASLSSNRNAMILQRIRSEAQSTHDELRQLRRIAQMNAKTTQDLLRSAFQKVCIHLRNMELSHQKDPLLGRSTIPPQTKLENAPESALEKCRKTHLDRMAGLLNALRAFEFSVEDIRSSVLNSNRKLRMVEVEQLTNSLTEIGKNAAELKSKFPELQTQLEEEIRENMENIVREENFIKEESQQVDECLRRCKNLANMMITMKKLAMVQDPTLKNLKAAHASKSSTTDVELIAPMTKAEVPKKNFVHTAPKLTGVATTIQANLPTDINNDNQSSPTKTKPDALDNILDELNFSPTKPKIVGSDKAEARFTSTAAAKTPPKPPERRRYNTTEVRMLYERENNDVPVQKLRMATSSFEIGRRGGADSN